jgi:hypothetical protein
MHKINLEEDAKPVVDYQHRLNPNLKEVVRKKVIELLEAGIIYLIADSKWVSPVHCVPKKGGITLVPNYENELVAQRTVTGYRMCIDFRKLNKVTKKNHIIYRLWINVRKVVKAFTLLLSRWIFTFFSNSYS